MVSTQSILKRHQLRQTQSRALILKVFLEREMAMSEREIEETMGGACDRVTIYRTLATFLEKGVVHKVLDDQGAMKYALCDPQCHDGKTHQHNHVHFKCSVCRQTMCLDQVPIPELSLPNGYALNEVNVLLQGTCPKCQG